MDAQSLPGWVRRRLLRLLVLSTLYSASAAHAGEPKVKFDLRSDEFPKAILEFSHQAHTEVLFLANDSLRKIKTHAVTGELEPQQALNIMLQGTGLSYEIDPTHAVIIKQPESPAPTPRMVERTPPQAVQRFVPPEPPPEHPAPLEEVMVTGSMIRTAMDVQSPLVVVTQSDFTQASYPTVQDALYQLPLNSLTAPRQDYLLNNNYNYGSGVDLRGLGVAATLVLVNGHRQPLSGLNGDFVDVSNIPMAAVERIEVLPDGASAIYGSDAIAGVVNIIMKDHFDGAETQVRYGGTAGGRDNLTVSQLLGTHWNSGNAMLVYQYSDSTPLAAAARGYAANADKTAYGGADYRSDFTDPGNILNARTQQLVAGIVPGTNDTLSSSINLRNQYQSLQIFPQQTSHSVYATGTQQIGAGIELFAEGRFTQRSSYLQRFGEDQTLTVPASNPYNPLGQTALVAFSFGPELGPVTYGAETRSYMGTLGARFDFGAGWRGTLSESYGRETLYNDTYNEVDLAALTAALDSTNPATAFNAFGGGNSAAVLAAISKVYALHAVSSIESTSFTADGPIFDMPAGAVKLAAGAERREEMLDHTVGNIADTEEASSARYSRHVGSVFSELLVPVIGDAAHPSAGPRLELNLAARYDDYSDFGHTLNPEFRVRFSPFDWLKLRASWGRAYRAPKLDDLYDSQNNVSGLAVLSDPKSPTGRSSVLVLQGDNPDLKQETAKTWTTGIDVVPDFDPDMKLSLTYYSIDYEGQIAQPAADNAVNILQQESEWSAFITRNPTAAQVATICSRSDYYGSRQACLASTPAAIVDIRLANLASTKVNGLDLDVHQVWRTDMGRFDAALNGTYVSHFDQAATQSAAPVDILNSYGNPLKFRFRGSVGWRQRLGEDAGGLGANLAVNFTGAYNDPDSVVQTHIDSLATWDAQVRYATGPDSGAWSGLELSLNAVNLFNQSPPFADSANGYDLSNFQALGRVLSLSLRKKW